MAKKKAGGGGGDLSKKTVQKKKQQAVEDKTFGLKNKNKSKKVQQQIQSIQKNVMNSGDPKMRKLEEERQRKKAEAKARRKAMKEEQDALFNDALLAVQKKTTGIKNGKVEAKGRDAEEEGGGKKSTSRAMKMMYQMDAQEMTEKLKEDPNYVPTVEDDIEIERQKVLEQLKKEGKKGTPVTPESFAEWQEKKRQKRAAEIKKKVEAEFKKKKGGKGLSVLSGRDLYEYKKELFNKYDEDDDGEEGPSDTTPAPSRQSSNIAETSDTNNTVDQVASKVQSDLFLQDADDDLDDIEDDE